MSKFFINNQSIQSDEIQITGKDVNHIKNVLRKKIGENVKICNTDTSEDYLCKIKKINQQEIILEIVEILGNKSNTEPNIKVAICQGLPKADKMELIIQKAVELGAYEITPIQMKRCVVKLNVKDQAKKNKRWQMISEVASKQCGRNIIPKINDVDTIEKVSELYSDYDVILVAYENEKENTLKTELEKLKQKNKKNLKIAIIIGPEGGLEEKEVDILKEKGAKIVTLGKRILRTETVALNMLSILMYEFEDNFKE